MHYPKEYFTLEKFQISTEYLFWPGAPSQRNAPHPYPKEEKVTITHPFPFSHEGGCLRPVARGVLGARIVASTY